MKKINKLFALLSLSALPYLGWAVPAAPYPLEMMTEDGTTITVVQIGDEFGSYFQDAQGNKYHRVNDNLLQPITENESSNVMRRAQERRAEQPKRVGGFPTQGQPKSLVILVNYTDVKFITPNAKTEFTRLLNESGYSDNNAIGSARDFFIASSDSAFYPQFDVYGPIELDHEMAYYGARSGKNNDIRSHQMIIDACYKLHDLNIVNFADYDYDNNKQLDNVFVYYAGHNEAEGGSENSIWPHQSNLSQQGIFIDGVRLGNYACTSELRGARGTTMCGIGTFCHEFGHVIGLPDLYNTENSSAYTLGSWDIMCSGSYNGDGRTPISYSAYERFYLGWLTPVQLQKAGQYSLQPLETTSKDNTQPYAYLIAASNHNLSATNPTPSEFFLIENRQRIGWDTRSSVLPGTGMLVWHIDYSASAWSSNTVNNYTPLRVHLEAAHGRTQSSSTASDPFPGTGNVHQFSPTLHNGTLLDPVMSIMQTGNDIFFTYKNDGVNRLLFIPETLDPFESTYCATATPKAVTPTQTVLLEGMSLDPELPVRVSGKNKFQVSLDSISWKTAIEIAVASDSTVRQLLYVRYNPNEQVCEPVSSTLTATQGSNMKVLTLQGTSVRTVLITEPMITKESGLTPYSYHIEWEPQLDAENYYITLYQLLDNPSNIIQSFESFSTTSEIVAQGWQSTTTATTTMAKEDGKRSLLLNNNTDEVITETYVQPISHLSFWYSALSTENACDVGVITIEAQSKEATDWMLIDTVLVKSTSKKLTYEKSIAYENAYIRFRIKYERLGGNGVAVDSWTATCDKEIKYVYHGSDMIVKAYNDNGKNDRERKEYAKRFTRFDFSNLDPQTNYFYYIQAQEAKGCEEHITPITEPRKFVTMNGEPIDSKKLTIGMDSINFDPKQYAIYVSNPTTGDHLFIHDLAGRLVYKITLYDGLFYYPLPTTGFTHGQLYIIKQIENGHVRRKQRYVKFVY